MADEKASITLAQLLKKAGIAESGGQAKHLVRGGGVKVNDAAELRPGRQLQPGDVVEVAGQRLVVEDAAAGE
jgi:ribosome-associated protein